jgi:hypothetical protein
LIVAVPGTAIYKIVTGAAPFPTDDSLTQFETAFTAQNLLVQAGLATAPATASAASSRAVVGDEGDGWRLLFGLLYGLNIIAYGVIEGNLDKVPPEPGATTPGGEGADDPSGASLSVAALASEIASQLFSVPWIAGSSTKPPGCTVTEQFGNLVWIIQWVEVGMDGAFFLLDHSIARISGDTGAEVATMWGGIHATLLLIYSFATSPGDANPWTVLENVATFVPEISKFGRLTSLAVETEGLSYLTVARIDVLADFMAGAIHLTRALAPHRQPGISALAA